MSNTPRRFNSSQRAAALMSSNGKCEDCNKDLQPGDWEADHHYPYSKGGATKARNLHTLCRNCNRIKGDMIPGSIISSLPEFDQAKPFAARKWQQEFIDDYIKSENSNYLLAAAPGAGKTLAAAYAVRLMMQSHGARQVVIVCPTRSLKNQWASAFHLAGIRINPDYSNSDPRAGSFYHGICVTYQQVASNPDVFDHLIGREPLSVVVLDEIHHAADQSGWGKALQTAFDGAWKRLCLTGTPFRTDQGIIPFLEYELPDQEGRSDIIPDYQYGYQQAVAEGVCRPVHFHLHHGQVRWRDYDPAFELPRQNQADFGQIEELPGRIAGRLRAAVQIEGHGDEFAVQMFAAAHQRLLEIRKEQPDAAGLLIARDQNQARRWAEHIYKTTGQQSTLVVSEEAESSKNIKAFRSDSSQWIVAVMMVSEGVDIPRLRVLCYATTITTDLFLRQATGRVTRRRKNDPKGTAASVFMPADPRLVELAQKIEEEGIYGANQKNQEEKVVAVLRAPRGSYEDQFEVLSGDISQTEIVIDGKVYDQAHSESIARQLEAAGLHASQEAIQAQIEAQAEQQLNPEDQPVHEIAEELRKQLQEQVNRLVRMRNYTDGSSEPQKQSAETSRMCAGYNSRANQWAGIPGGGRKAASPAQLQRALDFLKCEQEYLETTAGPFPEEVLLG